MDVVDRLETLIRETGATRKEIAAAAKISQSAISAILLRKNAASERTLQLIAEAYGYNEKWLINGEGESHASKTRKQQIMDLTAKMLQAEEKSFISRVGAALSELTPDEWEVFENFCKKLLKDRPKEGE